MFSDFSLEALNARLVVFLVFFLPMLLGVVLHELAHGWMALRLGDPTAKLAGRLTLNPIKHLDPMGSLIFVLTAFLMPFVFGWAKPVPVDFRYFKNQRQAMFLVSISGAAANFFLAVGFAILVKVLVHIWNTTDAGYESSILVALLSISAAGVSCNLVLAALNLLPIPPLDGSKVLASFMPREMAYKYLSCGRYGFIIVMLLMITGVLNHIFGPIMSVPQTLLAP